MLLSRKSLGVRVHLEKILKVYSRMANFRIGIAPGVGRKSDVNMVSSIQYSASSLLSLGCCVLLVVKSVIK